MPLWSKDELALGTLLLDVLEPGQHTCASAMEAFERGARMDLWGLRIDLKGVLPGWHLNVDYDSTCHKRTLCSTSACQRNVEKTLRCVQADSNTVALRVRAGCGPLAPSFPSQSRILVVQTHNSNQRGRQIRDVANALYPELLRLGADPNELAIKSLRAVGSRRSLGKQPHAQQLREAVTAQFARTHADNTRQLGAHGFTVDLCMAQSPSFASGLYMSGFAPAVIKACTQLDMSEEHFARLICDSVVARLDSSGYVESMVTARDKLGMDSTVCHPY